MNGFERFNEPEAAASLDRCARRLAASGGQLLVKRIMDVTIALALLIVLSPVFLAAVVAVKLSSRGPVLFQQEREGRNGRRFRMLKFRSMRTMPLAAESAAPGVLRKLRHDPRVTPVGRWLRVTSVDELPQLINVLRGEMSLVGPRALIPFMLEGHPEFRRVRGLVPPGITGLWQIRDRSNNTTVAAMLPHDVEYLGRFRIGLDLLILLRTIPAVLFGRGAF